MNKDDVHTRPSSFGDVLLSHTLTFIFVSFVKYLSMFLSLGLSQFC